MRVIKTLSSPVQAQVCVPGSKSYTHRVLIAAALSNGPCVIHNALASDDTQLTLQTLRKWGVRVEGAEGELIVHGRSGKLDAADVPILDLPSERTARQPRTGGHAAMRPCRVMLN